ncbi:hypothetical protein GCM10023352_00690 [Rothia endophytica]|uniref:Uncharacterized protein n=1 Tax=Rothia endophytica TaxID=1324766 RepID=A0ABP9AWP3_9MICC
MRGGNGALFMGIYLTKKGNLTVGALAPWIVSGAVIEKESKGINTDTRSQKDQQANGEQAR